MDEKEIKEIMKMLSAQENRPLCALEREQRGLIYYQELEKV